MSVPLPPAIEPVRLPAARLNVSLPELPTSEPMPLNAAEPLPLATVPALLPAVVNVAAKVLESVSFPPPPANDSKLVNETFATVPADGDERANVSVPVVPVIVSVPLPPMTDSMSEMPPVCVAAPVPRLTETLPLRPA